MHASQSHTLLFSRLMLLLNWCIKSVSTKIFGDHHPSYIMKNKSSVYLSDSAASLCRRTLTKVSIGFELKGDCFAFRFLNISPDINLTPTTYQTWNLFLKNYAIEVFEAQKLRPKRVICQFANCKCTNCLKWDSLNTPSVNKIMQIVRKSDLKFVATSSGEILLTCVHFSK